MNPLLNQNPFQKKAERILIDLPQINPNLMVRLRIRFTNTQESILMNQKFGKVQYPSKIIVQNSMNGEGLYLSSSPLIDFPFNMKTIEQKFEPKNMIYLSYMHIYLLKQSLKKKLREIMMPGLYYYIDGVLTIDQEKAKQTKELIPLKGILMELHFCVVQDKSNVNNPSYYEGIRIFNRSNQTFAELTIDEIGCFISLLDGINIPQIALLAMQCGLQVLELQEELYKVLNISRN